MDAITEEPAGTFPAVPADADHTSAVDQVDAIEHRLEQIEQALRRLDDGTYSTCQGCGLDLDDADLAEDPTTSACARCAEDSGTDLNPLLLGVPEDLVDLGDL